MITLKIVLEDKKEQLQAEQYFKTQPQIDLYIEEKADKDSGCADCTECFF